MLTSLDLCFSFVTPHLHLIFVDNSIDRERQHLVAYHFQKHFIEPEGLLKDFVQSLSGLLKLNCSIIVYSLIHPDLSHCQYSLSGYFGGVGGGDSLFKYSLGLRQGLDCSNSM